MINILGGWILICFQHNEIAKFNIIVTSTRRRVQLRNVNHQNDVTGYLTVQWMGFIILFTLLLFDVRLWLNLEIKNEMMLIKCKIIIYTLSYLVW